MLERWLASGLERVGSHHPRPLSRRRPLGRACQGRDGDRDERGRGRRPRLQAHGPGGEAAVDGGGAAEVQAARRAGHGHPVDRRGRAARDARGGIPDRAGDRPRHAEHAGAGRHEHDGRSAECKRHRSGAAVVERLLDGDRKVRVDRRRRPDRRRHGRVGIWPGLCLPARRVSRRGGAEGRPPGGPRRPPRAPDSGGLRRAARRKPALASRASQERHIAWRHHCRGAVGADGRRTACSRS